MFIESRSVKEREGLEPIFMSFCIDNIIGEVAERLKATVC